MEHILRILLTEHPHVIVLQEVVDEMYAVVKTILVGLGGRSIVPVEMVLQTAWAECITMLYKPYPSAHAYAS